MGAPGGGVTPTPSSSAALVLPLLLLPLLPLVSLLDRLLVASLISTSTAVSPCVCPCERASERGSSLLRHAAQPQPLCSACAPEPTPCLIIQDMSTAFHRRHGQQEPGQGRGRPPAQDRDPGLCLRPCRAAPQTLALYTLVTHGGLRWSHSQATQGRVLHPAPSAPSATFGPHPRRGQPTPSSGSWPP